MDCIKVWFVVVRDDVYRKGIVVNVMYLEASFTGEQAMIYDRC